MKFTRSIIDNLSVLHSSIVGPEDLGPIGELEGANHPVSPNDLVTGFPQLCHLVAMLLEKKK
jgi:hypothetical protein